MSQKFDVEFVYTAAQNEIFFGQTAKYIIVPKGRRSGITLGGAQAYIEFGLDGLSPLLWIDTINGNIDRYFERYFLPRLKKLPANIYNWNQQKRELKIKDSVIDFRSSDKPESIEGFGYKKIFMNEAGIILKDNYLYTHAVLPMLLDFPDSQLIAAGVPKGKHKKDGSEHIFYSLNEKAKVCEDNKYKALHYTTYDNPFLDKGEIDTLIKTLEPLGRDIIEQEIGGEFVERLGDSPFFTAYDEKKHESMEAIYRQDKPVYVMIDFNLNPFAVNFAHLWKDERGEHFHMFDEIDISNGSIPKMVDEIKNKYADKISSIRITGDATGQKKSLEQRDNANYYIQLMRGLGLNPKQLEVPSINPTHENSREACNYILYYFPDFKINPVTCPALCRDMKIVQADAFGSIIKKDRKQVYQQGDHCDCIRYGINTWLLEWKNWHQKRVKK